MLVVGKDKSPLLHHLPDTFLLIDDGELIDALPFPNRKKVTHLNLTKHSLNPLKDITLPKARALSEIIYSAFPQGENTLTVRNGKRALTKMLLQAKRFDRLPRSTDDYITEANNTVDDLLLSPLLQKFLCRPLNFSLSGIILARINRAEMGDLDAFIIGNVLVNAYPGTVVIPDFGFYACSYHTSLIRQKRLMAGVNYLNETKLTNDLLRIETRVPSSCLYDDAETLAKHECLIPGTTSFSDFMKEAME